jgi:hypothetical protein
VQQEALEPEHSGVVQAPQLGQVARHRAAPEPHVDPGLAFGGLAFDAERGHVDGGRDAVERHVQDRGDSAGGRRAGGGGESLPLGAARLVDVHMGVDQPRQQHLLGAEVHHVGRGQVGVQRFDRNDPTVGDPDPAGHLAGGGDHSRSAQHQVELFHDASLPSSPVRLAPGRAPSGTGAPSGRIGSRPLAMK